MIQSFKCKQTQELFGTGKSRQFANIKSVAERKLTQLSAAVTLEFLKSPPGNHLELLAGDRAGQYSIRINQQWRLCFVWTADGPADVEIVDYH
jgi:proteic killer suppression protein